MSAKSVVVALVIVAAIAAIVVSESALVGQSKTALARVPFIDVDLCTGCELCVETVPAVFQMDGDIAGVFDPEGADEQEIQEAMDNCPVEAISWQEQ